MILEHDEVTEDAMFLSEKKFSGVNLEAWVDEVCPAKKN